WSWALDPWSVLVEVAELIVETFIELWLHRVDRRAAGRLRPPRPADRRKADHQGAGCGHAIRDEPCKAVEPTVHRRAQHPLAAVLRDERFDDLVVVLALVDQRREHPAHFVRRPAIVLAALRDVLVAAGAAGADDLVLHLLLEVAAGIKRRPRIGGATHPALRR